MSFSSSPLEGVWQGSTAIIAEAVILRLVEKYILIQYMDAQQYCSGVGIEKMYLRS